MAISPKQLAANRANAQKSTGPKTPAGKAVSSRNSTRHGFCGRIAMLNAESRQAYASFARRYLAELKPLGVLEEQFVRTIIDSEFQILRVRERLEEIAADFGAENPTEFHRLNKYLTQLERSSSRATNDLRRQRKFREDHENHEDIVYFEKVRQEPYQASRHGHLPRGLESIGFDLEKNETWLLFHRMAESVLPQDASYSYPPNPNPGPPENHVA